MAVETIVMDLTLRLVLNGGLDKNGKTVFKNKQFKRVKTNADLGKTKRILCLRIGQFRYHFDQTALLPSLRGIT